MYIRIDKVIVPPGLIANSKTYTLILTEKGLYIIHTGSAGRDISKNFLEKFVVDLIKKRQLKKIDESEEKINKIPLDELVKEKNSRLVEKDDIINMKLKKNFYNEPQLILKLKLKKKKYKFQFRQYPMDEVKQFVDKIETFFFGNTTDEDPGANS